MEVEAADLFEQRGVRSHREKKFFRKRKVACGPDLLQKHCIYEQSFQEVGNYLMNEIPNENIFPGDAAVKDLELDPFAAPSFYALYSLNKKKRWMVEKLMSEDVESYQTETLRVSAASLAITALDTRYYAMGQAWYYMKELAARSHHSYRKGEEIHESSRNGRLDQYLRPENPPARRRGRRLKKRPYPERDPDDVLANRSETA
uniref:Ras-GEF domain-containing protein n=1 Tax=Steinernema glaseri TaxID=37863 RepID=A0A1I8AMU8_9BILA